MTEAVVQLSKGLFSGFRSMFMDTDPLVEMFQTEYKKDYEWARKCGAIIDGEFVRKFLNGRQH